MKGEKVLILGLILFLSLSSVQIQGHSFSIDNSKEKSTNNHGPMDSPWPMYGHDLHHSGQSEYNSTAFIEKWRFRCDSVESSVVIDGNGILYFGSFDGYLYSLFPNGTLNWRHEIGGWIWDTPALSDDGTLYVSGWGCRSLVALYSFNGTEKWRYDFDAAPTTSVTIGNDGTLYVGTGVTVFKLFAINTDGSEKWSTYLGYYITSTPAIGDDGTIYIGCQNGWFYALDPNNGTIKWDFHCCNEWVAGSPSIAQDGTIYIGDYDTHLYALNPNGTMKWVQTISYGTSGVASIGNDGIIYVTSATELFAIFPNGTIKWIYDAISEISSQCPLITNDGRIFIGSQIQNDQGGELIALDINGIELFRKQISNLYIHSSPVMANDGTVYIGSSWEDQNNDKYGFLHAFGPGPLKAEAYGPYSGYSGSPLVFAGDAFAGEPPYFYHWTFGDGNISEEQNPTHVYLIAGDYQATLTIIDSSNNVSVDDALVTIVYPKPTVHIIKPTNGFYFFNTRLFPFRVSYIVGPISIEVEAYQIPLGIDHVDFIIDNVAVFSDYTAPYSWNWTKSKIGHHYITIIAYDHSGNSSTTGMHVFGFLGLL